MAKKVVSYSRPVIDKLSIKLTETYIVAFVKDVSTYTNPQGKRLKTVVLRASYVCLLLMHFYW